MSLDVTLTAIRPTEVYSSNITHNLGPMAKAADIYKHLWRPEEIGITKAVQLIEPLRIAVSLMEAAPSWFQQYDSPNGWGKYEHFLPFVKAYLAACEANPNADVSVSR